ncbi:MAG: type II secretion system protein [Gammaproteobacteria bacterium]|nr:type II secretion system protein [Gammaproteobacteria bacterium]
MARLPRGFTLIELLIALTVLGILAKFSLPLWTAVSTQIRYARTDHALNQIERELLGFLAMHGRLPCPATAGSDGAEDCSVGAGFVPAKTLGLGLALNKDLLVKDGWNNPIEYQVGRQSDGQPLFESAEHLKQMHPSLWASSLAAYYGLPCRPVTMYANQLAAVVLARNKTLESDLGGWFGPRVETGPCRQDNDARLISEHRVLLEMIYSGALSSL